MNRLKKIAISLPLFPLRKGNYTEFNLCLISTMLLSTPKSVPPFVLVKVVGGLGGLESRPSMFMVFDIVWTLFPSFEFLSVVWEY